MVPQWKSHIYFAVRSLDTQSRINVNGHFLKILVIRYEDLWNKDNITCFEIPDQLQPETLCYLREYELYRMITFLELPYKKPEFFTPTATNTSAGVQTRSKSSPIDTRRKRYKKPRLPGAFVDAAPPLDLDRIRCAFSDQKTTARVKKREAYQKSYQAIPSDLRLWFLNEIKEEFCYLGYMPLFEPFYRTSNADFDCKGIDVAPHLTYSKIVRQS